jgi:hypothetical protein
MIVYFRQGQLEQANKCPSPVQEEGLQSGYLDVVVSSI